MLRGWGVGLRKRCLSEVGSFEEGNPFSVPGEGLRGPKWVWGLGHHWSLVSLLNEGVHMDFPGWTPGGARGPPTAWAPPAQPSRAPL